MDAIKVGKVPSATYAHTKREVERKSSIAALVAIQRVTGPIERQPLHHIPRTRTASGMPPPQVDIELHD
jgi:hypothetical protein